jgi:uncharacterized membrane protein YkgB
MKNIFLDTIDRFLIVEMHKWGIPLLRISLGIVFLWFGLLKIFGVTPVTELVASTYWFFPTKEFLMILGLWEAVIGVGLILKLSLRFTLALLWVQMAGTLFSVVLDPQIFFQGNNPLLLTLEGEFVIKNLVLIAGAIVIGGYEVKPDSNYENPISG